MKVHVIQHVLFEGPGVITGWADSVGHSLTTTRLFEDESFPPLEQVDLLVVMGGPMGTDDEEQYPWLLREKTFLKRYLGRGKKVMGICLGAQLLAKVLGAPVYKSKQKEIGWFPIRWKPNVGEHPVFEILPKRQTVLHWHGDTFDLPDGALHLASSEACKNQGFLYGDHAMGLQFHLEMTPEGARELTERCSDELLDKGDYIQSAGAILAEEVLFREANQILATILDAFVSE